MNELLKILLMLLIAFGVAWAITSDRKWMSHSFWDRRFGISSVVLVIGWLMLGGHCNQAVRNVSYQQGDTVDEEAARPATSPLPAVYMILGTLAYRSAKRRLLGLSVDPPFATKAEYVAITLVIGHTVWFHQDPVVFARDPLAVFVAVWVVVAYVVIEIWARKRGRPTKFFEEFEV